MARYLCAESRLVLTAFPSVQQTGAIHFAGARPGISLPWRETAAIGFAVSVAVHGIGQDLPARGPELAIIARACRAGSQQKHR